MVEWCPYGPPASKNPWQMDQRVSLITLGVADLARARAFYEALGFRLVRNAMLRWGA